MIRNGYDMYWFKQILIMENNHQRNKTSKIKF